MCCSSAECVNLCAAEQQQREEKEEGQIMATSSAKRDSATPSDLVYFLSFILSGDAKLLCGQGKLLEALFERVMMLSSVAKSVSFAGAQSKSVC